jgi:cyclopropane-fatty-acyl-phospholipid synthase
MGEIDVDGDFREALRLCQEIMRSCRIAGRPTLSSWPMIGALAVRLGAVGGPPGVPDEEAKLAGRSHSKARDLEAIAHHYDLGNEFYQAILDPSMAYSCAYWSSTAYQLADAQREKLDLVCRKLGLRPGMRLLDIGCGWGSLVLHAAQTYGVRATGVTISARQSEFVRTRIAERGLGDLVDVRLQDYREANGEPFDAVASIEMGEHVGEANYPRYAAALRESVRPGGRVLIQQICRGPVAPGGGAFIESYIAPDMTMRPLHRTLGHLEHASLEIRDVVSLREHYVRTIDAWAARLNAIWDDIVRCYGVRRARIWRLYLAGSALAFEENRMSVHQILALRSGRR